MKGLPRTVIALGVTSLFTDVASEMVVPLLPAFIATLGAGPTFLGLIEGVADAVAAALKYASGKWTDAARLTGTRRRYVLGGYALASLVRPLLAFATAAWHVLAIRVVDRVGKGVRSAPRDALIADSVVEAESGRAFGFHQAMDHAGAVLGPLLATSLLAFGVPLRLVFAVAFVPGALAIGSIFFAQEPKPSEVAVASVDQTPLAPSLRRLILILAFFALWNSSDVFLLVRLQELGAPPTWLPLAWLTLHLAKMVWSAVGGGWADRFPKHRLLLAGWGVYAVSYLALAAVRSGWQAWLVLTMYGAFAGLAEPTEKAMVKALSGASQRGRAFGLYHGLLGAAAVPAGLITGGLWQTFGAPVALVVGAAGALVSALALGWWVRTEALAA
jgi:MFS family permease